MSKIIGILFVLTMVAVGFIMYKNYSDYGVIGIRTVVINTGASVQDNIQKEAKQLQADAVSGYEKAKEDVTKKANETLEQAKTVLIQKKEEIKNQAKDEVNKTIKQKVEDFFNKF